MLSLLRLELKQKTLHIYFEFAYFSFFRTHLELKTINTFKHSHARFKTKMGKVYTRLQTKTAQIPCVLPIGITGTKKALRSRDKTLPRHNNLNNRQIASASASKATIVVYLLNIL